MKTTNIYALIDPRTNEVRYVGKSDNPKRRLYEHCKRTNDSTHKSCWIKGLTSKKLKPIIEVVDIVPYNEWQFWEQYWVSQMKTWGFNLTNLTNGGEKQKITSEVTKQKLRLINLGKKHSEKTKKKMSDNKKGKQPPYMQISGMTKTVLSKLEKTQFKNGNEPWNKYKSGYKTSKRKKVLQYSLNGDFIREWESVLDIEIEMNLNREAIRNCCLNKTKKSYNFIWKYK